MRAGSGPLGLYVHVPFCRTRCRYCDFYRVGEDAERIAGFLAALEREIDGSVEFHGASVDTVFFGGGTPSLLAPEAVAGVLERLARRFSIEAGTEVSLEANPSDLDAARLAALRRAGVNRLSVGVQSFVDRELALLGRRHDAASAARAIGWAREAGFETVSLDLMLGIPGQTRGSLRATIDRALSLAPDHLSAYLLEVHPGAEMDGLRRRRPRLFPGPEAERRAYLFLDGKLERAGLARYEISNWARPGHECRHNLKYWRSQDTVGFGPAAHSCVGGRRWRHAPDLVGYLRDPLAVEELDSDPAVERLFLGLRLAEGLEIAEAAPLLGLAPAALPASLATLAPFLECGPQRVRLTADGVLVSNSVLAELLLLRERAAPPSRAVEVPCR